MSYPKFNPKAPYGTSSPIENGCVYYQNGHHYDIHHNCVDFETGKILQKANPPEPEKARDTTNSDKLAEQQAKLNAARNPRVTPEQEGDGDGADGDDGGGVGANADGGPSEVSEGIDLVKWAQGEAKGTMWMKVKAAMVAAGYDSPEKAADAKAAIAAKHGLTLS